MCKIVSEMNMYWHLAEVAIGSTPPADSNNNNNKNNNSNNTNPNTNKLYTRCEVDNNLLPSRAPKCYSKS